jgi:hypothetical protein
VNGVIERVLENWLDNASERTFQIPFCHMLQAEGYTVLHMTRHCSMEMGKDIIAIDSSGTPCAFQLKGSSGKKISLNQWRTEINPQVNDLIFCKIIHPSIDEAKPHRSFLVTNGEIDEEVCRAIDDFNRQWFERGQPDVKLETIVRGQMLEMAKKIGLSLWPSELVDVKTFLEIYLCDGRSNLPKDKLAALFDSTLLLSGDYTDKKISKAQCIRNVSSCSLLCAAAISSFSNCDNYLAEIEAWTMYLSYIFSCAEKWNLACSDIQGSVNIALSTIYNCLGLLCDELISRNHYVEGDAMTDKQVYSVRLTMLTALMSVYGLWRKSNRDESNEQDSFIKDFLNKNINKLYFWGEKATSQFISIYWYWRTIDASYKSDYLLASLLKIIISKNNPKSDSFLPNPYFDEAKILPHILKITTESLEEDFRGNSYSAEAIMHLFVRRNWKQEMKSLWPGITHIGFNSFYPEESWQFYLWRSKKGKNMDTYPPFTKTWGDLKRESTEHEGKEIPEQLKNNYMFMILFLIVYPHRVRSDVLRWLDSKLLE